MSKSGVRTAQLPHITYDKTRDGLVNPPIDRRMQPHPRTNPIIDNRVKIVVSVEQTLYDVVALLENRLSMSLSGCQFYLQDRIKLRGESPLLEHCVDISGMVQLLLEIKTVSAEKSIRLNVVDIQIPEQTDKAGPNTVASDSQPHSYGLLDINSAALIPKPPPSNPINNNEAPPIKYTNETTAQSKQTTSEPSCISPLVVAAATTAASDILSGGPGLPEFDPDIKREPAEDPDSLHDDGVVDVLSALPVCSAAPRSLQIPGLSPFVSSLYDHDSLVRWAVDSHYRRLMEMNNIARDPAEWNTTQVIMWSNWAFKQFRIEGIKGEKLFDMPGSQLLRLQADEWRRLVPNATIEFFTHIELLKRCRQVCVPYRPQPPAPFNFSSTNQRSYRQTSRSRSARNAAARQFTSDPHNSAGRSYATGGVLFPSYPTTVNGHSLGTFDPRMLGSKALFIASEADETYVPVSNAILFPATNEGVSSLAFGPPYTGLLTASGLGTTTTTTAAVTSATPTATGFASLNHVPGSKQLTLFNPNPASYPSFLGSTAAVALAAAGQVQLWQFLLELLTDWRYRDAIHWISDDGEFKLSNPDRVAAMWGQRKNKPAMNYEKLSRALRYYYDGDMISKVQGKRFVYKFICDMKTLLGFSPGELYVLVKDCAEKHADRYRRRRVLGPHRLGGGARMRHGPPNGRSSADGLALYRSPLSRKRYLEECDSNTDQFLDTIDSIYPDMLCQSTTALSPSYSICSADGTRNKLRRLGSPDSLTNNLDQGPFSPTDSSLGSLGLENGAGISHRASTSSVEHDNLYANGSSHSLRARNPWWSRGSLHTQWGGSMLQRHRTPLRDHHRKSLRPVGSHHDPSTFSLDDEDWVAASTLREQLSRESLPSALSPDHCGSSDALLLSPTTHQASVSPTDPHSASSAVSAGIDEREIATAAASLLSQATADNSPPPSVSHLLTTDDPFSDRIPGLPDSGSGQPIDVIEDEPPLLLSSSGPFSDAYLLNSDFLRSLYPPKRPTARQSSSSSSSSSQRFCNITGACFGSVHNGTDIEAFLTH